MNLSRIPAVKKAAKATIWMHVTVLIFNIW